jgi:hypothetical protein
VSDRKQGDGHGERKNAKGVRDGKETREMEWG